MTGGSFNQRAWFIHNPYGLCKWKAGILKELFLTEPVKYQGKSM